MCAFALTTSVASADDARSVRVRYADVNMTTSEGVQVLYARLRTAAHHVCVDAGTQELQRLMRANACFDKALDDAVAHVGHTQLVALHTRRTGRLGHSVIIAAR